jgi:PAS domain S-box-containing protein
MSRKTLAALGIALLGLAALAGAGWQSIARLRDSAELVRHTRDAQARIGDVYHTLLELEVHQRTWMLTGAADALAPYRAGQERLQSQLGELERLQVDHPEQQPNMVQLRQQVGARLSALDRSIGARGAQGAGAAQAAAFDAQGQPLMAQIRETLERMDHEEARVLALHEAAAEREVGQYTHLGAAVLAASALLLLALHGLLRREQAARRRVERLEAEQFELLEREVEHRTGELTQAHQALAVSEARLRGIFDAATDAILTVDDSQRVVLANPAAARMLGLPQTELVGAPLARFIPTPSRERHGGLIEAFGRSSEAARPMSPQREVTGLRADGSAFPIEAAISHLHLDGQRLYTVILRDITERKQAETELRQSETRLRQVLMVIPEAVLVHTGGRVSFVNDAAQRLFAAEEPSLLGREALELVHPDSQALMRQRIAELLQGERAVDELVEIRVRRFDGNAREVQATGARIELHGELSVLVLMRDVTEVRRTQTELQRSQARFRDVLMHLPEPVFIRADARVVFVNRAALELFGVREDAVIGRSPLHFCDHDGLHHGEATVRRPDGGTRVVEVTGSAIEFEGRHAVIVMLRDLSPLRRAQRELAASYADLQRLVSQQDRVQEEERKRIARELHDELQQRLAAVLINLSAARTQLRRNPTGAAHALEAAEELAGTVIESTRRIVKDLRPQMLDELGLVPALEALCAQFSAATGIACAVHAEAAADERASAAPTLATCLYRVAQESLNNVAKHARASAVQVRLALDADARELMLQVSDDGQGLPEGTAPRKPESFGLLGMNERLRMLGGTLALHGAPGQGTTVAARVPLGEAAMEAA